METATSKTPPKSKTPTLVMAVVTMLPFLAVTILLDSLFGSFFVQDTQALGVALIVVVLLVITFYQLITPPAESEYGLVGIVGWAIIGGIYAILFRAIVIWVQNKFLQDVLALGAFGLTRQLVFKLLSFAQSRQTSV